MSAGDAARLNEALQGRYRIERRLGEGGMATVYLAADLRHERRVALKVLKPELTPMVGAQRFFAEIKTTANLQHPHILPLFDSGEAEGSLFYVMPYVQGESLKERLEREHQLPVDEAVHIAVKIAAALQAAHDHGVIHRDIKPANILLSGGEPLVADFGIALAAGAAGDGRFTETGVSLGTPRYMSPEQATGDQAVGAATDVYALGCVLYEMLTGDPPFTGRTTQAVLGKIISEAPRPITRSRRTVPGHVESATLKALERIPADRFSSAEGFARALTDPAFRRSSATAGAASANRRMGAAAVLALAVGVAAGRWLLPMPAAAPPVTRYQPVIQELEGVSQVLTYTLAISPDGARIAYVAGVGDGTQVWVRERDRLSSEPVRGTQGAVSPFFSPDGDRIGFITREGALRVTSASGGEPLTLVASRVVQRGAAWGPDGYVYFDTEDPDGLKRVSVEGGRDPEPVYREPVGGDVVAHARPVVLPGGRAVMVTVIGNNQPNFVGAVDIASGQLTRLVEGEGGVYATTGHLVYVEADGSLLAAPFDERSLRVTGPPALIEELGAGSHSLALSNEGRLVYTAIAADDNEAVWVDRQGVDTPVDPDSPVRRVGSVALSSDGTKLAIDVPGGTTGDGTQVWIKSLPSGPLSRLTFEGGINFRPEWFADGDSVLFISDRGGSRKVWKRSADGTGSAALMLDDEPVEEALTSSDGRWLVYRKGSNDGTRDIYAVRLGGEQAPFPVAATEFDEVAPALSPDGRWLAYSANVDGQWDVYVRPFPSGDRLWRASRNGGYAPVWSSDGRRLYFQSQADVQWVVDVLPGDPPTFGVERSVFPMDLRWMGIFHRRYDLAPQDDRFVMVRARWSDVREQELFIVENFPEVLRSRMVR